VEEGDIIHIDIPNRKLELEITAEELSRRLQALELPEPKVKKGYLARYARQVTSANTGAIFKGGDRI
jgi:dihydroxy-acid dehydratase